VLPDEDGDTILPAVGGLDPARQPAWSAGERKHNRVAPRPPSLDPAEEGEEVHRPPWAIRNYSPRKYRDKSPERSSSAAERVLGEPVGEAVINRPGLLQRRTARGATRAAGELAGLSR